MALWKLFSKKKSAQDMLVGGDLSGALKAFKKQLKAKNNKDPLLMLKIGSIYQQMGDSVRARSYFMAVGEYYGDQGFLNKAVAAYKKALDITPNDKGILDKLASYNNKVPKYMINTDILKRIRENQVEPSDAIQDPTPESESASTPVQAVQTPAMDIHEATYKFPDLEEESAQLDDGASNAPSLAPEGETPAIIQEILEKDAVQAQQDAGDQEEDPSLEISLADASLNQNPLQMADADFDPNASLNLDEDDMSIKMDLLDQIKDALPPDEAAPSVLDVVDDHQAAGTTSPDEAIASTDDQEDEEDDDKPTEAFSAQRVVAEANDDAELSFDEEDEDEDEDEEHESNAGVSRRLSDDQKMVFSLQASSEKVDTDDAEVLRSFLSLDDALEDLFSTEADEDKALRKEQDQRHFPLFRTMTTQVFLDFVMALENQDFENGSLIVKQGDPGTTMFLMVEGDVEVILSSDDKTSVVAKLEGGDFFGEVALISGQPRTASVVAKSPTSCLVLSREHFEELALNHPSVVETIRSVYYARMRENESRGS